MTEEYKLPVFFKYNEEKLRTDPSMSMQNISMTEGSGAITYPEPNRTIKLVFVCEDSNPRCLDHLTILSEAIFRDFKS